MNAPIPTAEPMIISLRAYAEPPAKTWTGASDGQPRRSAPPSDWVLVFDTETTTDAGHALRFGSYQVRAADALREAGLFYEPDALTEHDLAVLTAHAERNSLALITRDEFIERVFYGIGYELRATIVGLNLPFDFSRLAIRYASARGAMRGGFTFALSADKRRPRLQIKHLDRRKALIRFAAPYGQREARSQRKRKDDQPVRRGFFVDVGTLAAALFARSFTLADLAEFLGVPHPKFETEEHGQALTDAYVAYAVRDTQTTWECYGALIERYLALGLADTPPHVIYSEASVGKAYLKGMGVQSWREQQPDAPPQLLAFIMGGYFGGRSEVRIRREVRRVVLCDFLSMYPTVCTLMRLWRFVIAKGMTWRDATFEVRELLDRVTVADLQKPDSWRRLTTLVEVEPDADILPVRAHYGEDGQATIGLNLLTADRALPYTLADCIASKLLTGRAPKIMSAGAFMAGEPQAKLAPVNVAGNTDYAVDPSRDDFFKLMIELRQWVKRRRDRASGPDREQLDTEQNSLKIAANATSYGVFAEVNVNERAKRRTATVHSAVADPYAVETINDEEPGRFFHPLLAALITGAARLMLATAERLILDEGLEWAFCDTDSMAIAKPEHITDAEFQIRVDHIVAWFEALNPYDFGGSILKIEPENHSLANPAQHEPLYCWAVSAKRYVLFNRDRQGRPVIRKASAHGLGHIRAPYDKRRPSKVIPAPAVDLSEIGVDLWQHDAWWRIAEAALDGHPDHVAFDYHPALDQPAVSRYAATRPSLLAWFKGHNANLPYARQVKPFGFLLSFFADPLYEPADLPAGWRPRTYRPVAAFDLDHARAARAAFDRETKEPVPIEALQTVAKVIDFYHLHPESKFVNANYLDRGVTERRQVLVTGVRLIGKEANRWEEQFFLGLDEEAQPDYGSPPPDLEARVLYLRACAKAYGVAALARKAGMPIGRVRRALKKGAAPLPKLECLRAAAEALAAAEVERARMHAELLEWARAAVRAEGMGAFARRVGLDAKNLGKVLNMKRTACPSTIARLAASRSS